MVPVLEYRNISTIFRSLSLLAHCRSPVRCLRFLIIAIFFVECVLFSFYEFGVATTEVFLHVFAILLYKTTRQDQIIVNFIGFVKQLEHRNFNILSVLKVNRIFICHHPTLKGTDYM